MRFWGLFLLGVCIVTVASCGKPTPHPQAIYLGGSESVVSAADRMSLVTLSLDFEDSFPTEKGRNYLSQGQLMILEWYPWVWEDIDSIQPSDILAGDWDATIRTFAQAAKAFEYPFFLSPLPFSNDRNSPLSIYEWCQKDVSKWLSVQRYIYNLIKEEGAENVLYVWSFSVPSHPSQAWQNPKTLLGQLPPGDWLSIQPRLDGGVVTLHHIKAWQSFLNDFPETPALLNLPTSVLNEDRLDLTPYFKRDLKTVRGVLFAQSISAPQATTWAQWQAHPRFQSDIDAVRQIVLNNTDEEIVE